MIIVLKHSIKKDEKQAIKDFLRPKGFKIREIVGEEETILGAVGQLSIDVRSVEILPGVDRVIPISKPYKLSSREFKKDDTIVSVGPVKIGGQRIAVIAGPCAVESREQIMETARLVRESGAVMLRGGAYKPRTSPYSFQGLGEKALTYLKEAGEAYGLPVVSEVVAAEDADMMKEFVDVFQIGTRNMQNFHLLSKIGELGKPVILKRGYSATIEEWLMASEYLLSNGTDNVILCERGIRTFETYTRNTLDLSAIPIIKKLSHLPIIVDPSHGTGLREKVLPMGLAATAAGADGLIVEVHPDPDKALSDGFQSLYIDQFEKLMRDIEALSPVISKEVERLPVLAGPASATIPQADKKPVGNATIVAFQGERGAFSESALNRYFNNDNQTPLPCRKFKDVFTSVLEKTSDFGILPIENSLAGSIHKNYDLLLQFPDIKIIGETQIRIEHNLIGLPGSSIDTINEVYSHPQGLAQCADFLDSFEKWRKVPFYDTAGSVAYIAGEQDPGKAAVASKEAARVYKMTVLKEGIETNPRNYTRFFAIAPVDYIQQDKPNTASLVFSTSDTPGALFKCLTILADNGLNMKKLESRPIHGKPWRYMFYVDIDVADNENAYTQAVESLKNETEDFRELGLYRA